jgi:hypothetical protein
VSRHASKNERAKARAAKRAAANVNRSKRDAYGGWKVAGDGRTVVGVCRCGQPAATDCAICGPQCLRCFMTENVNDHAP